MNGISKHTTPFLANPMINFFHKQNAIYLVKKKALSIVYVCCVPDLGIYGRITALNQITVSASMEHSFNAEIQIFKNYIDINS